MDVLRLSAVARRRFVVGRPIRVFCTTPKPAPDLVSSEKKETTTPPVKNIFGRFGQFVRSKRDDVFDELQKIENRLNSLREEDKRLVEEAVRLGNGFYAQYTECAEKIAKLEKDLELQFQEKVKELDKLEEEKKQMEKQKEKMEK